MNGLLLKLWKFLPLSKNARLLIMRLCQNQFLVGVTGIIFNEKDDILLFKHTYREVPWSLPGGYLKAGEHPVEGLEREIEEESGFIVNIEKRLKIRTDRDTARLDICYIGTYLGGEFKGSDEVSEFGFFAFEKLPLLPKNQILLIEKAQTERKSSPIISTVSPTPPLNDNFLGRVVDRLTE